MTSPAPHRADPSGPASRPPTVATALRWLFRFGLALLAIAIVLEVLLRTLLWGPHVWQRDPEIGSVGRPHARVVRSKEGYFNARLNERGLVDGPTRPQAGKRVIVLGDSFTQALQVPLSENFTSQTERLLPGVDVINAGGSGRSPAHAPAALDKLLDLEPDVVVVQVSEADYGQIFEESRMHLVRSDAGDWEFVNPASYIHYSTLGKAKHWVVSNSSIGQILFGRFQRLQDRERRRLSAKFAGTTVKRTAAEWTAPPPDLESAHSGMDFIFDELRQRVPRVVVLFLPDFDYSERGQPSLRPDARPFWIEFCARNRIALADPTDAMRDLFRREGTPSHGFHNSEPGFGHMNEHGHRLAAEALAKTLEEILP